MKKRNIFLIATTLVLVPNMVMAEGLNLQNVLGAIVQGAAQAIENNQRQQNGKSNDSPAGQTPTASSNAGGLAVGTECGNINGWAAGGYHISRTEQLFGKSVQQWTDGDFAQANSRVSACRGVVDANWRGRTDSSLQYLSEAKRSWDRYRAEGEKIKAETTRVAAIMPPDDAEQFFSLLMELNKTDPYAELTVSASDVKPALPNGAELRWKIDTRQYEQALKDLNARFTARIPDHMPAMMAQLRMAVAKSAQEMPETLAKVKGLKGQELTWSIPLELVVSGQLSALCAKAHAMGFRGDQTTKFQQGCEQYAANSSPEVIGGFKQQLSMIPASVDDVVVLGRMCKALGGTIRETCSEREAQLRRGLSSDDLQLAKAWLGEPLSCDEAVRYSDMDVGDLKDTFFLDITDSLQPTGTSFYDQVCAAALQGVQLTFVGQGMFSGPDELFIQTNERTLVGLKPVRLALKTTPDQNGDDVYYGVHLIAEVWDAFHKKSVTEDRPLEMMQNYPSEWLGIKKCMASTNKRGMGPGACGKQERILLFPNVR